MMWLVNLYVDYVAPVIWIIGVVIYAIFAIAWKLGKVKIHYKEENDYRRGEDHPTS